MLIELSVKISGLPQFQNSEQAQHITLLLLLLLLLLLSGYFYSAKINMHATPAQHNLYNQQYPFSSTDTDRET